MRGNQSILEVMIGDLGCKKWKTIPENIYESPMVVHDGNILICGGHHEKSCLQLRSGVWKEHSILNEERNSYTSFVSTPTATFAFGGGSTPSYEYLPKDSTTWRMGKNEIPGGPFFGSAVAGKSGQEIWLIRDYWNGNRILKFNVNDHTFREMGTQLNVGRYGFKCCFIPNTNKIMITGGYYNNGSDLVRIDSTEIYNTEDESITMASPMNFARCHHGMGVITINGQDTLVVIGGSGSDGSVELYNIETKKWEISNIRLNGGRTTMLQVLQIKLADIMSKNI